MHNSPCPPQPVNPIHCRRRPVVSRYLDPFYILIQPAAQGPPVPGLVNPLNILQQRLPSGGPSTVATPPPAGAAPAGAALVLVPNLYSLTSMASASETGRALRTHFADPTGAAGGPGPQVHLTGFRTNGQLMHW